MRKSSTATYLGIVILVLGALAVCAAPSATAQTPGSATIRPILTPDRFGAEGALAITIHFAEGESAVPSPLRHAILRFPAGLGIEIPHLRSCSVVRLRTRGAGGCPAQSLLGRGHALVEAQAGSQIIAEEISLWLFLGPFHNLEPTFEILGQGYTPFDERVVFTGTVMPDKPPYGEDLVLSVPAIPTLPLEPDASILTMTLTVGASKSHNLSEANTIVVPSSCPAGGFPFAADLTYADGSSASTLASASCPG
jgi:hypothetical protein